MMKRGGSLAGAGKAIVKGIGKIATKLGEKAPQLLEDMWKGIKKGATTAYDWGKKTVEKGMKFYAQHEGVLKKGAAVTSQVLTAATPLLGGLLTPEQNKIFEDAKKGISGYAAKKDEGEKKDTGGGSFYNFDAPNVHLNL